MTLLSFNAPRNPLGRRTPCRLTPYASEFGARNAAVLLGLPGRAAHQCEHCPHTWHTGPAPKRAKAVA